MAGDLWRRGEQLAVRHYGDAPDTAMVIADEAHVREQCREIFPAGERWRFDHDAAQFPLLFEIGVDCADDRGKIFRPQRAHGLQKQYTLLAQQLMLQHDSSPPS